MIEPSFVQTLWTHMDRVTLFLEFSPLILLGIAWFALRCHCRIDEPNFRSQLTRSRVAVLLDGPDKVQ